MPFRKFRRPKLKNYFVFLSFFFKKDFIYLFLERREGRERNISVVTSLATPPGDLACNLGTCPDWERNTRPFGLQAGTQSAEPHQPGLFVVSTLILSRVYSRLFQRLHDFDITADPTQKWVRESGSLLLIHTRNCENVKPYHSSHYYFVCIEK